MAESIFIKGATIATFDGGLAVLKHGSALVEDGRFVKVGKAEEVRRSVSRPDIVIDGRRKLVMPGLVNTHAHLAQSLLRSVVPDDVSLLDWLRRWVWPLQASFAKDDGVVSARLALLEMIRTGTTAFVATSINGRYDPNRVAEAVRRSGIRAALGRQVMDVAGYAREEGALPEGLIEDPGDSLKSFRQLRRRWNDKEGMISVWLSPRTPGALSPNLLEELGCLLKETGAGLTMHLAEVKADIAYFKSLGTTPSAFLSRYGLLGRKAVYVHCVWLDDEDIAAFARNGASVSHNPSSNAKLGSGIAPVVDMMRRGVNVALGTDGGPSNDTYDMIRECKLAALLQKVSALDPAAIRALDVLKMAVTGGYRAMGLERTLGKIKEGMAADFITLDLKAPHLTPSFDVLSNVVYAASGQDVNDVVVAGRPLMLNRKVLTLDEERVLSDASSHAEAIAQRAALPLSKARRRR